MIPQTIGREYDVGKLAPVQCVKDDTLKDLDIKDNCFLLLIVREGAARFRVGNRSFEAAGPCFVCFDERESPRLIKKRGLKCDAVYFHPSFLNVNMTFKLVHSSSYSRVALSHDLFLLRPFTDGDRFVFPLFDEHKDSVKRAFQRMDDELTIQPDWYWSCRSRSHFMEIILMLEKTYGFFGQDAHDEPISRIADPHLRDAVVYIESNYQESITVESISKAASMNHSTLNQLFKLAYGTTPMGYLWQYRVDVAKKHLEFTNLPLKDISLRCGFKTTQHFVRKFGELTGATPADFRETAVAERKAAFK